MAKILLIDDAPDLILDQLRKAFPAALHRVEAALTGAEGLDRVRTDPPDVILLDLRLPGQSGLDVYQQIQKVDARIPVIFVTLAKGGRRGDRGDEAGRLRLPVQAARPRPAHARGRRGARGLPADARAGRRRRDRRRTPTPSGAIVGCCPAMQEVYKAIGRVAAQDVTVLIPGESGTGKELVARAIYQHGPRAKAPFLAINCAAIPETLLESELFGHEKGAFTGADRRRIGKFEQCNGGTLFLDEVGDMPLALQAKLLRVLQEQAFERVGGNETIRTDVRLIAATNRDLKAWSERGAVPPGPVLPAERVHHPPAAAARAGRRPAAAGAVLPAPVQPRAGAGGRRGRPRRRWSCCATTPGRATSASCRASSSRRCSRPGARSCSRPSSRPFLAGSNGPAGPAPADDSAWRRSSGSVSGPTPASCTRRRMPRSTGSCCPSSWNTPGEHPAGVAHPGHRAPDPAPKLRDLGLSVRRSAEVEEDDQP